RSDFRALKTRASKKCWSLAGSLTVRADVCPEVGGSPTTTTGADVHARKELHRFHFSTGVTRDCQIAPPFALFVLLRPLFLLMTHRILKWSPQEARPHESRRAQRQGRQGQGEGQAGLG